MKRKKEIWIPTLPSERFREERRWECDADYHGSHGIPVSDGLEEIDSWCRKDQAELKKASLIRQKSLEASLLHLQAIAPHTERLWAAVQERVGQSVPHFVMPLLVALIGIGTLTCEAVLLAPAMDVLSVTDPRWQLVAALWLAAGVATAFHFAWEGLAAITSSTTSKVASGALGLFVAAGLVSWGILRGLNVRFVASLDENPLGAFLGAHRVLANCFYIFVTLGIPLIAATASHFSVHRLHDWWEWKRAKRNAERLSKKRTELKKQLELELALLPLSVKASDEKANQEKAIYRQHHMRGGLRGAKQEPYWTVPIKATAAAFGSSPVLFFFSLFPWVIVIPPTVWTVAYFYFRTQWHSPGPIDFFDLERVQFKEPAHDIEAAEHRPTELPRAILARYRHGQSEDKD